MKIIQVEVNHFQLNKPETISSGNNKIKFFIILISLFLIMKKIKVLSISTRFSWKKFLINLANNGKYKLISCSDPMHPVDKFL